MLPRHKPRQACMYSSTPRRARARASAPPTKVDEVTRDELIIMLDYVEPEPAVPEEVAADDAAAAAVTVDDEEEEEAAADQEGWDTDESGEEDDLDAEPILTGA